MTSKTPRDWRELCRRAAEEMDPDKLMDLVVEINQALDEHIKRRRGTAENVTDTASEAESQQSEANFLKVRQPRQALVHLSSLNLSRSPHLA